MSLKEKLGSIFKRKQPFDDSDSDQVVADNKNDKKGTDTPAVAQPSKPATVPPKTPDPETVKIEGQIAALQDGLGRIESSITKAMTSNSSGFEDNIKGLMQKLDDMVIAMQSQASDRNSPFNSSSLVQELPESVGLGHEEQKQPQQQQSAQQQSQQSQEQQQPEKATVASSDKSSSKPSVDHDKTSASGEQVQTLMESIADALQQGGEGRTYREEDEPKREMVRPQSPMRLPLAVTRLQEFVKSCALLEIVDGDQKRMNYLYDIGILRTEDLEVASRIVDLLGRYSPNLKPVDLAIIACSIEETAASDRETRKLLAIATALNKSR